MRELLPLVVAKGIVKKRESGFVSEVNTVKDVV